MQIELGRGLLVDQPQETDKFGGAVAQHALADDRACLHVEGSE